MVSASFTYLATQKMSEWSTIIYISWIWITGFGSPFLVIHLTLIEAQDCKEVSTCPFFYKWDKYKRCLVTNDNVIATFILLWKKYIYTESLDWEAPFMAHFRLWHIAADKSKSAFYCFGATDLDERKGYNCRGQLYLRDILLTIE